MRGRKEEKIIIKNAEVGYNFPFKVKKKKKFFSFFFAIFPLFIPFQSSVRLSQSPAQHIKKEYQ